ncbi:MAG: hypothetical protein GX793_10280 [Bacteroidales bacterium]|jgi:hypothetical protein|nr:hypothetical protein [Bacteroidales bacterium]MCK9500034.1 hypothetical protein [Bacteroidales bacterium]MDY0313599.1 hypothetical protein [Bacteroidales bacterium]NLB87433.1 hypothetical protein [Bacteroidales bacterium]
MFVRKKKNPSGIISIQVIDKSSGKYKVVKTIGSSSDTEEIRDLYLKGKKWISSHYGVQDIFIQHEKEKEELQVITSLLLNIENILLNGTQLILNQVFNLIGFNAIKDEIFKHLVVSRISQALSKSATIDW